MVVKVVIAWKTIPCNILPTRYRGLSSRHCGAAARRGMQQGGRSPCALALLPRTTMAPPALISAFPRSHAMRVYSAIGVRSDVTDVQGDFVELNTGDGEKLSYSQAEPGQLLNRSSVLSPVLNPI